MATVETHAPKNTPEEDETLGEMPLLDAVQSLVEKERTLMQLKVAEAKDEINAWKEKYNHLAETQNISSNMTNLASILPAPQRESDWSRLKKAHNEVDLRALRFIDLSNEGLTELDLPFIARRMPKVASLPQLSLAHNKIKDSIDGSKGFSRLLDSSLFIILDLSHNDIGSIILVSIFGSFAKGRQSKLQSLLLHGNWKLSHIIGIGEQIGSALLKCGPIMPKLRSLKLTLSDDAPNKSTELYDFMKPNEQQKQQKLEQNEKTFRHKKSGSILTTHGMSGKIIKPKKPYNALEFLKKFNKDGFPKINDLSLVGARLSRDSILELCIKLKHPKCSLTSLDLTYAQIGPMGCKQIAKAISYSSLSSSSSSSNKKINKNGIGGGGGGGGTTNEEEGNGDDEEDLKDYLGIRVIPTITGLINLCLAHCGIASSGCQYLCHSLMNNTTLTRLDISNNDITDVGALELAKLINPSHQHNKNKQNVMKNNKQKSSSKSFSSMLVYLDVGGNSFGKQGLDVLLQAASTSPSLLALKGCEISTSSSSASILQLENTKKYLLNKKHSSIRGSSGVDHIKNRVILVQNFRARMTKIAMLQPPKPPAYLRDHRPMSRLVIKAKLRRSDDGPFIWRLVMTRPETTLATLATPATFHSKLDEDIVLLTGTNETIHETPTQNNSYKKKNNNNSDDDDDDNSYNEESSSMFYSLVGSVSFEYLKTKWTRLQNNKITLNNRVYGDIKLEVCACNYNYTALTKQQLSQLPPSVSLLCENFHCLWTDNIRDVFPLPVQSSTDSRNSDHGDSISRHPVFNQNPGRIFQYQDMLDISHEQVKEPINQAKQIKFSGQVENAYNEDTQDTQDTHLWSNHLTSPESELNIKVPFLCSLLLKYNVLNYNHVSPQKNDSNCFQCIRQIRMSQSSLASSLTLEFKLSPKTETAAQEVLKFEMALMVEHDGRYELLSHITQPITGSDLWRWTPLETVIDPIKSHDLITFWVWSLGSKNEFLPKQQLGIEINKVRLCCDQCLTSSGGKSSTSSSARVGDEAFIFMDAKENNQIKTPLNFASPFPLNHSKSGAQWF